MAGICGTRPFDLTECLFCTTQQPHRLILDHPKNALPRNNKIELQIGFEFPAHQFETPPSKALELAFIEPPNAYS